ncbi:MAG: HD domain-containing protein, partial [Eggerthellaceae bacterium]|nr:HD domain-containing protein [Eggerthellaceae bacterium]
MAEKRTHIPFHPIDDGLIHGGDIVEQYSNLLCREDAHDVIMTRIDDMGEVIPELIPMKGFDQRSRYHCYDVLEHTAYVVQYVKPTPLLRWAALLHDVGKPHMFAIDERGTGHFKGHAWEGANMTRRIMTRLGADQAFSHQVELLVRYHDDRIEPTEHAV